MKKRWILPGLLVAAFALAATGLADPGHGHGKGHGKHGKFGPYDVVTDDHGSCGNAWAVDTEKRTLHGAQEPRRLVHAPAPGPRDVPDERRPEPGRLRDEGHHGATVVAGVKGRFHGYLRGKVTGGTFNPNATCPADCGFTDVWIATFFGPSATFSCFDNSKACRFDFEYSALKHQSLKFRHWYDKGNGAGTFLKERFRGDIANA